MQNNHEVFMRRCIELAKLGEGNVAPNPLVGSVLVCENKIIGEGFHKFFGESHAEVNALNSVIEKELISKSTLYVNLEPCSHFGKTPPCSNLIIENKIKKVVIGCRDIFSLVNGKGIEQLIQAGVEVIEGVLEEECKKLNKTFFCFHKNKRPFITLKWASSNDNFIGKIGIQNLQISNDLSSILVHKLRSNNMAIVIGTTTAENDNPKLTTRKWYGKSPLRIVFNIEGKLNSDLNVFSKDENYLVVVSKNTIINFPEKNILRVENKKNSLQELMLYLYQTNTNSILVEGGEKLLQSFINQNLWDEAILIKNDKNIFEGVNSPILNCKNYVSKRLGSDTHYFYTNEN